MSKYAWLAILLLIYSIASAEIVTVKPKGKAKLVSVDNIL